MSKDLRRAFIKRNKDAVCVLDMVHIVGQSCELDLDQPSPAVRTVQAAVGHKDPRTTVRAHWRQLYDRPERLEALD